jgi:hypothetical protein
MRLGAELAASQINQQGGIDGRPLSLLMRDDSANAEVAARVAQDLVDARGRVPRCRLLGNTRFESAPMMACTLHAWQSGRRRAGHARCP